MATTDITYNTSTDTAIVIQENTINLSGKTVTANFQTLDGVTTTAILTARFTVTQTGIPSIFSWDPDGLVIARGQYRIQFTYTDGASDVETTNDWTLLLVR